MWIVLGVSVAGSVGLLLHAAGRAVSPILVVIMVAWVAAPFAALVLMRHRMNNAVVLSVTVGSLIVYAIDAVKQFNSKAAFVYVVVPFGAWLVIAAILLIGRMQDRFARRLGRSFIR